MENAKLAQQRLKNLGFEVRVDGDFGAKTLAALMTHIAGKRDVTDLRRDLGKAAARHFDAVGIKTPLRLAHALAQQCVETGGFAALVESLNYSAKGLQATFGRTRVSDADAARYGRKDGEGPLIAERQKDIANLVYGGEWGRLNLGNTKAGDGWRFRGRGPKQVTGRSNYAQIAALSGLDLLDHPELLEQPDTGMKAACLFWKKAGCNKWADEDDVTGLTRTINGGLTGLDARKIALARAKAILL